LCEGGFTGHFFWVGPDFQAISRRLVTFLRADCVEKNRQPLHEVGGTE